MADSRLNRLLHAAADTYADGRNPFASEWLGEHRVTAEECMALSDRIALVLRGYLAMPESERLPIQLAGAMALSGSAAGVINYATNSEKLHDALQRLGRVSTKGDADGIPQ